MDLLIIKKDEYGLNSYFQSLFRHKKHLKLEESRHMLRRYSEQEISYHRCHRECTNPFDLCNHDEECIQKVLD